MLSREIRVSCNLVSYREREASQVPGNSDFVRSVSWKLSKKVISSLLLLYDITWYLFLCLHLFNILVRLFSILLFLCNAIFSFSLKHSELFLLLFLYVCSLPKIDCVMFVQRLLFCIFQNSLDDSVFDVQFLWLNNFL